MPKSVHCFVTFNLIYTYFLWIQTIFISEHMGVRMISIALWIDERSFCVSNYIIRSVVYSWVYCRHFSFVRYKFFSPFSKCLALSLSLFLWIFLVFSVSHVRIWILMLCASESVHNYLGLPQNVYTISKC